MEEVEDLLVLLDLFADRLGLEIIRGKSILACFGLSREEEAQCSHALGTEIKQLPMKYLGLLQTEGCLRIKDWQFLMMRVESRLEGW